MKQVEYLKLSQSLSLKSLQKDDSICLQISPDLSPIRKRNPDSREQFNSLIPVLMQDSDSELLEKTEIQDHPDIVIEHVDVPSSMPVMSTQQADETKDIVHNNTPQRQQS